MICVINSNQNMDKPSKKESKLCKVKRRVRTYQTDSSGHGKETKHKSCLQMDMLREGNIGEVKT